MVGGAECGRGSKWRSKARCPRLCCRPSTAARTRRPCSGGSSRDSARIQLTPSRRSARESSSARVGAAFEVTRRAASRHSAPANSSQRWSTPVNASQRRSTQSSADRGTPAGVRRALRSRRRSIPVRILCPKSAYKSCSNPVSESRPNRVRNLRSKPARASCSNPVRIQCSRPRLKDAALRVVRVGTAPVQVRDVAAVPLRPEKKGRSCALAPGKRKDAAVPLRPEKEGSSCALAAGKERKKAAVSLRQNAPTRERANTYRHGGRSFVSQALWTLLAVRPASAKSVERLHCRLPPPPPPMASVSPCMV